MELIYTKALNLKDGYISVYALVWPLLHQLVPLFIAIGMFCVCCEKKDK